MMAELIIGGIIGIVVGQIANTYIEYRVRRVK